MTHRGPFQPLLFCDSVTGFHVEAGDANFAKFYLFISWPYPAAEHCIGFPDTETCSVPGRWLYPFQGKQSHLLTGE